MNLPRGKEKGVGQRSYVYKVTLQAIVDVTIAPRDPFLGKTLMEVIEADRLATITEVELLKIREEG